MRPLRPFGGTLRTAFEPRSRPDDADVRAGEPAHSERIRDRGQAYGIAAIDQSTFFIQDARFVFAELKTWGWILLIVGVIQLVGAFGIWSRRGWGRWIGIISASGNAVIQLLFIAAFPLASLALLAIDILVIYGLASWDHRER